MDQPLEVYVCALCEVEVQAQFIGVSLAHRYLDSDRVVLVRLLVLLVAEGDIDLG